MDKRDRITPDDEILRDIFSGYADRQPLPHNINSEIFNKISLRKERQSRNIRIICSVSIVAGVASFFIGVIVAAVYFFEIDYNLFFNMFRSINFKSLFAGHPNYLGIILGINTLLLLSLYSFLQHKIEKRNN